MSASSGYRPPRPRLWWFVIGGAGLTAVGDAVWAALRLVWHNEATPSLADIPYLASYPLIGAGLLVLIRSRTASRDRAGLLDATIVAAGLFVLSWAFLIAPTAGGSDLTVLQRLATAAYPVGDVLLLALVARLVTTPGARTRAYWLLVCALLASLLANAGYAVESVVLGRDTMLALFDLGWVLFPVLLGAAALHPSMAVLSEPAPDSERRLGRGRLMLLASASLLAPGTQLLQVALGREINAVAIGLGSAVLFVLVLLRVAGLLERVRSQAVQLAALARDDALTGLPNRRTWDFELTRAFAQAGAQGDTLAVGLLDLDHFKAYNDSHGHQAGDRLLTAASAAWRALLPPGVVLARYGGDEFGLLLPGHDLAAAAGVLDELVAAVPEGQTLSVGSRAGTTRRIRPRWWRGPTQRCTAPSAMGAIESPWTAGPAGPRPVGFRLRGGKQSSPSRTSPRHDLTDRRSGTLAQCETGTLRVSRTAPRTDGATGVPRGPWPDRGRRRLVGDLPVRDGGVSPTPAGQQRGGVAGHDRAPQGHRPRARRAAPSGPRR